MRILVIYILFIPLFTLAQSSFKTIIPTEAGSPTFPNGSMTQTSNGFFYAVGSSYASGYSKNRLVKLDQFGTVLLDTTYSAELGDEFKPRIIASNEGGVYLACKSTNNPLDDYDDFEDILVQKIDEQGSIVWSRQLPSRDIEAIVPSEDGSILVLGETHEEPGLIGLDVILYKLDSLGNEIWLKQLGQPSGDFPAWSRENSLSINEIDDGIYISGYHIANEDVFTHSGLLYKLNGSDGSLLWDIYLEAPEDEKLRINTTFKFGDRYFFTAGDGVVYEFNHYNGEFWETNDTVNFYYTSKGFNYSINCSEDEITAVEYENDTAYFRKYNEFSDPYYERVLNETENFPISDFEATPDGGFIGLAGTGDSLIIIKMDCLGNVSFWGENCNPEILENLDLTVYPNPSQNEIYLDATFEFSNVTIYGLNGQKVEFKNPCLCKTQKLDLSNLASGVYAIKIEEGENIAITKFVKI